MKALKEYAHPSHKSHHRSSPPDGAVRIDPNATVRSKTVSRILRSILKSTLLLIFLIFYSYQEGAWKEIVAYYRFFFDYKKLRLFILSFGPFAAVAFIVIQSLQVVFAPVPGEITGFVGGLIFGNTWGAILSTIGLTLGSLGARYRGCSGCGSW